jgi:hypothetical protein
VRFKSTAHIDFEREQFEFAVDKFLRSRDWKSSSNHPGAYWLWTKEIDGRVYTCGKSLALSLEESVEAQTCACPDEFSSDGCPVHDFGEGSIR